MAKIIEKIKRHIHLAFPYYFINKEKKRREKFNVTDNCIEFSIKD